MLISSPHRGIGGEVINRFQHPELWLRMPHPPGSVPASNSLTGIAPSGWWAIDLHWNVSRAQAGTVNTWGSLVIGQLGVVGSVANWGVSGYLSKAGSCPSLSCEIQAQCNHIFHLSRKVQIRISTWNLPISKTLCKPNKIYTCRVSLPLKFEGTGARIQTKAKHHMSKCLQIINEAYKMY